MTLVVSTLPDLVRPTSSGTIVERPRDRRGVDLSLPGGGVQTPGGGVDDITSNPKTRLWPVSLTPARA
jgi:hypothetical protein